jgi:L-lactate dehydrogenase
LALVSVDAKKLDGETMDLHHCLTHWRNGSVESSTDFKVTAGSSVVILTCGARRTPETDTRLDLIKNNVDVFKRVVPEIVKNCPKAILLVVTNPVDVLTYATWKLSGLPKNQVLGSGTTLDSSRFRFAISRRLDVAPSSIQGFIIGEHGESSVPVWSGVNVAGVRLMELNPKIGQIEDPEQWHGIHEEVVKGGPRIVKRKGYTNWGIAVSTTTLCESILRNQNRIYAVSTSCKGFHGIEDDVFMSLPCVLGESGVSYVVQQTLSDVERRALLRSADVLRNAQKECGL